MRRLVALVLSIAVLCPAAATASDPLSALPTDLDAAFRHVAQEVRFEPYPGVLRGAEGAAAAKSGNAWDKALLLAELLRRGGYEVRFAEGNLEAGNLSVLLRGAYPPKLTNPNLGPDFAPYDPTLDARLRTATNPHVWVELNQGKSWLPLDPSYPRAKIGEAYAVALRHFSAPPDNVWQTLSVVWMEQGGKGKRELARVQVRVAELGLQPISLSELAVPLQRSSTKPQKSGGAAGLFGAAFGGGAEKEPEPEPVKDGAPSGAILRRTLQVGERAGEVAETLVLDNDRERSFARHWLELTLSAPGREPRVVRRELFGADGTRKLDELWGTRRYTIGVFGGPVSLAQLDAEVKRARALPLEKWQDDAEDLDEKEATRVESALGRTAGYLLTLTHAQAADALTDRLAKSSQVLVVRDQPRLIISSIETRPGKDKTPESTVTLDLRHDEVLALPFPGQAARAAELFQVARGMVSSAIEGEVVASATGQPQVSTAALMAQASSKGVALLSVTPESISTNRAGFDGLTREGRALIEEVVRRGHHAVVPVKALALGGKPRTGFWQIDPETGAAIGVMDDGLHQAMAQYSLEVEKIGMNPDTGLVVGAIVGAITVTGMLAAKVLEYGGVTQEVLKQIRDMANDVRCYSCPQAELKVEAKIEVGNDCLKLKRDLKREAFAKANFCEKYAQGFKCSMQMLLAAYGDEGPLVEAKAEIKPTARLACKKWPAEGGN